MLSGSTRDTLDVVERPTEQVGSEGGVSGGEDRSGPVDALLDEIGMAHGVLLDGPVHHVGLGGVDQGGGVADPLLRLLVHLIGD